VRHRRELLIAAAAILLGILVAGGYALNAHSTRWVRGRAISELERRFDADVTYSDLNVTVLPSITVEGRGFVLRKRDNPTAPFITIKRFAARTDLWQVLFKPRRVQLVELDGLDIQIDRRRPKKEKENETPKRPPPKESPVVVDQIASDRARVIIIPKKAGKDPLEYDIHQLVMREVGLDRPAPFEALLTNATPPGDIHVKGRFGPWHAEDPGQTPVAATYTFSGADLGVFRGIAGILSSTGKFAGPLERLDVHGETDTPDFMVARSGHRVNLHTRFHAIVDGTNGDTLLEPVEATFLRSALTAKGGVVKREGERGKSVVLDVVFNKGRIEDIIRLVTKAEMPLLTGPLEFHTKFDLPPRDADVMDRLRLNGQFGLKQARFTSPNLREKLRTLSRKGQGKPEDEEAGSDVSRLTGQFTLWGGTLQLRNLQFQVESAAVLLDGSYVLRTEELDFRGKLRLAAKVSQTTTGVKSFFLKLVDPLFKKRGAGAEVPIKITGTREKPEFGLDVGKVFKR
jgi:AsmA-like C-terminal region